MSVRDYKRPHRGGLGADAAQLRGFALGLGIGLAVAAIIYIGDHRVRAVVTDALRPVPQRRAPDDPGLSRIDAAADSADGAGTGADADADAGATGTAAAGADAADDAAETARGAPAVAPPAEPNGSSGPRSAAQGTAAAAPAATVGKFDFYRMLPRARVAVATDEHISSVAPTAPVQQPGTYFLQIGSYRDAALAERVRAAVTRLGIVATVQRIAVGSEVWERVRVGPVRDLSALNRLRRELQAAKLGSLVVRVEN